MDRESTLRRAMADTLSDASQRCSETCACYHSYGTSVASLVPVFIYYLVRYIHTSHVL